MTDSKKSLRYTRYRTLLKDNPNAEELELRSFQAKGFLQQWFPMPNGLGFILDKESGKYVIE